MLAPIRTPATHVDARVRVEPLLTAAAGLAPGDHAGWAALRADTDRALRDLVEGGRLPRHLLVGPGDPPVVVARTLAAAWRLLSRPARPA